MSFKILLYLCFCSMLMVGQTDVQFLNSLETKKSAKKKSKAALSTNPSVHNENNQYNSFLSGLSKTQNYKQREQEQEEKSQKIMLQQQANYLNLVQNYYGSELYQSAMAILNNNALQTDYNKALSDMKLFFFEYMQNVITKYHSSGKQKNVAQNTTNISTFLNSLTSQSSQKTVQPIDTMLSTKQTNSKNSSLPPQTNSAESFLNSLQG